MPSVLDRLRRALLRGLVALALAGALGPAGPGLARAETAERRLDALADEVFWAMQERGFAPDVTERGNRRWLARLDAFAARLARGHGTALDPDHRVTRALLARTLEHARAFVRDGWVLEDVRATDSLFGTIVDAVEATDRSTARGWRETVRVLERADGFMSDYISLLERGLAEGRIQPGAAVEVCVRELEKLTSLDPKTNPLVALEAELEGWLAGRRAHGELRGALRRAVRRVALPAHARLRAFLVDRYLPRAPRSIANPARYAFEVSRQLGPDARPEELAARARSELPRLRAALLRAVRAVDPSIASLESRRSASLAGARPLRTADDAFRVARAETRVATEFARGLVPVPRSEVRIRPVPVTERATTLAQYRPVDGTTGDFEVNPEGSRGALSRALLATVATHEVAGHHVQAMRTAGERGLPDFRREYSDTVFDEGWAVYVEHARDTRGAYDPHERIAHLEGELFRAAVAVAEVGLHLGTMTRDDAEAFLVREARVTRRGARATIDRMVSSPGQLLTYTAGRDLILGLRRMAERRLGPAFDERGFHRALLRRGSLTPELADRRVRSYAARRLGQLRGARARRP